MGDHTTCCNLVRLYRFSELSRVAKDTRNSCFNCFYSHWVVANLIDELGTDFKLVRRQINTYAESRSTSEAIKRNDLNAILQRARWCERDKSSIKSLSSQIYDFKALDGATCNNRALKLNSCSHGEIRNRKIWVVFQSCLDRVGTRLSDQSRVDWELPSNQVEGEPGRLWTDKFTCCIEYYKFSIATVVFICAAHKADAVVQLDCCVRLQGVTNSDQKRLRGLN